jgi:hypothetical protein
LLKGPAKASRYLTTDLWEDKESYETFQERFADDYKKIDAECEKLAQAEQRIGLFERLA